MSLMPLLPFFVDFLFAVIHTNVDANSLIRPYPIYNLSSEISKMLKTWSQNMSSDETRKLSIFQSICSLSKVFKVSKIAVLSVLKRFFTESEQRFVWSALRTHIKRRGKNGPLNGLFNETGSTGMLAAFDHKIIDKMLLFLSALVEECCGRNGTTKLLRVFTMYVVMLDLMYRNYLYPGWLYKELEEPS